MHATTCTGEPVWTFCDPDHKISCAILSATSDEVFAGDYTGSLFCMACRTGTIRFSVCCHSSPVTALARASGGKVLATGHADGTVCCLDALTGAVLWATPGSGDPVRVLSVIEKTGNILVIHSHDLPVTLSGESGS
ncbi:MAG TPA: PQQ-binding-like beta-propeller repeat protein, partial [Methanoregula sp.]|nr:PQQ-binding-like beta-propeller repeat protein [Methanoregula sp.]